MHPRTSSAKSGDLKSAFLNRSRQLCWKVKYRSFHFPALLQSMSSGFSRLAWSFLVFLRATVKQYKKVIILLSPKSLSCILEGSSNPGSTYVSRRDLWHFREHVITSFMKQGLCLCITQELSSNKNKTRWSMLQAKQKTLKNYNDCYPPLPAAEFLDVLVIRALGLL